MEYLKKLWYCTFLIVSADWACAQTNLDDYDFSDTVEVEVIRSGEKLKITHYKRVLPIIDLVQSSLVNLKKPVTTYPTPAYTLVLKNKYQTLPVFIGPDWIGVHGKTTHLEGIDKKLSEYLSRQPTDSSSLFQDFYASINIGTPDPDFLTM